MPRFVPLWIAVSLSACTSAHDDDDALAIAQDELASTAFAASGWVEHAESPIVPWCAAVLVAPDVAVTSAGCASSAADVLVVGFGGLRSGRRTAVDRIELQTDAMRPDLALAALVLREPVVGLEPATLGRADRPMCGVQSVSYSFVLRGDADSTDRWTWSGCLTPGVRASLEATDGTPNCHGDVGAGAFAEDGALLGLVVDGWSFEGCVRHALLATVDANLPFFAHAVDLSRPPG